MLTTEQLSRHRPVPSPAKLRLAEMSCTGAGGHVETREAAERFARTWEAGWAGHDVAAIAALYAEDCVHRSMPFRPVHQGRRGVVDYVEWAFSTERATEVRFGPPMVDGDLAMVEYWAKLIEQPDPKPATIAGCAIVRFRSDGLVAEARDYWHVADGHQTPQGSMFLSRR